MKWILLTAALWVTGWALLYWALGVLQRRWLRRVNLRRRLRQIRREALLAQGWKASSRSPGFPPLPNDAPPDPWPRSRTC